MDQWLVRTHNNVIAGPFNKDQVVQLIREGKLSHQDEVCCANEYWIALHERDEVMKQLGVEVPKATLGDEEVTETQTETATETPQSAERTDPQLTAEVSDALVNDGDHTGVITSKTLRELHASRKSANTAAAGSPGGPAGATGPAPAGTPTMIRLEARYSQPTPPQQQHVENHQVVGESVQRFERPTVWRSFAWILIVVVCLIVFAVLRVLKNQPV
jgi:hypothetical protein